MNKELEATKRALIKAGIPAEIIKIMMAKLAEQGEK